MGTGKTLLDVLNGKRVWPPPMWLMRQAGRYLPEYRALRAKAGGFLDLVYNPELATEITLQPIRRFGFDAAILFSDILVIPDAIGQSVRFEAGEGPRLEPLAHTGSLRIDPQSAVKGRLAPVVETVARLRMGLPESTTLIGFCGAPWTVATYMIAGEGTPDQAPAKKWAYERPEELDHLLQILVDVSAAYLVAQVKAGADVVQIFDTWAGSLDSEAFQRFVVAPTATLVRQVRAADDKVKIIGFPKGIGSRIAGYVTDTGVDAVGVDWSADMAWVCRNVTCPVQGNLDPMRLLGSRAGIDSGVERIFIESGDSPLIFNLGHGIGQETPIEAVEYLVERVRKG